MNSSIRALTALCGVALILTASGCKDRERGGRDEDSALSELIETESRDLGQYSAINLRGAAELKIVVGEPESIKIVGGRREVKGLRTEVRDNTLHIYAKKPSWSWFGDDDSLMLRITLPKLLELRSSGAGSIDISGLNGGEQLVNIAGAHNIEAKGQLDKLTVELNGAGNVDYGTVVTKDAAVIVNGAGHVLVNVSQSLSATMNGVGAIHYQGQPQKVESNLHGVGTISRK